MEHVAKILISMINELSVTVLPPEDLRPGSGTLYNIKEKLGEDFDILDIRTPLLRATDVEALPYIEDGVIKWAENNTMKKYLTENVGTKPKLVLLVDYSQALPHVRNYIEKTIASGEFNSRQIHYVKIG